MRTTIDVYDMTPGQWAWLNTNIPDTREFAADEVRVCVALTHGTNIRHVEMSVREFMAALTGAIRFGREELAQAILTPDARPDGEADK